MFNPIQKQSSSQREEETLAFWKENDVFQKSLKQRVNAPHFTFYDGPPFATGLPHYGHLLAGIIKDVVPRYKSMQGYYVPRRFGWDCHGLPVENEIEKEKKLSGSASIEEFGIARFNEECRKIVLRYSGEWKKTVDRIGRWVDFEQTYHTMDLSFMESVWWVFKQLFEKGLVYEGHKVMPVSAKLGTPLSNFEASQNYVQVDDPSLSVSLPLKNDPETSLVAWTTTPWTLISNLSLAVGKDISYLKIKDLKEERCFILAKERISAYYKDANEYEILQTMKGKDLVGLEYEPLFPHFKDRKNAFFVIAADFVSIEDGTGIVHLAPGFGEDDFYACQKAGIDLVCPINNNGIFTDEIPEYAGMFFKDVDKLVIKRLKSEKRVVHQGVLRHRYPYCWRSDTPLIYKAVKTWFVAVEKIKDGLLKANEEISWTPSYLKHGRFGKWLENARDWAISRNRYWGTPIPLWRAEDGSIEVIGSIDELERLSGKKIDDLHRHYIDDLSFEKDGKTYHRIKEVFDCWFESGSMPYAQNHYPFGEKELQAFPADFIAEGLDQTRGWFYTLTVLSVALFNKPAFKNVIVNGILLAEDGAKMSKRLRNYPEPQKVLDSYGADAVRLYLLHSPAVRADDLCFSEKGVALSLRKILIPCWNAYVFFMTYARIYDWRPKKIDNKPSAMIDRWILSLLNCLIKDVEKGMNAYDLSLAVEPFVGFIDQLTNWYIRRCRRRFWSEEATQDRFEAFATLYKVLLSLSKIAAPFVPFISEAMYRNLRGPKEPISVHLCKFPSYDSSCRDEELEKEMSIIQKAVSLGHSLRKEHKIKVRQPLSAVHIACRDTQSLQYLKRNESLIKEELNVKAIELIEDESGFVSISVKPNFKVLGKKIGSLMRPLQKALESLSAQQIQDIINCQAIALSVEGQELELQGEELELRRQVKEGLIAANEDVLTLVLDTKLTESLLMEGLAREIVNKVSSMRRDADFDVSDRIKLVIDATERVRSCFAIHGKYIQEELLVADCRLESTVDGQEWDLNGEHCRIHIEKMQACL